jgi:hypothetical protein
MEKKVYESAGVVGESQCKLDHVELLVEFTQDLRQHGFVICTEDYETGEFVEFNHSLKNAAIMFIYGDKLDTNKFEE